MSALKKTPPPLKMISVRVPVDLFRSIDVTARRTGLSRTEMVRALLENGMRDPSKVRVHPSRVDVGDSDVFA